MARSENSTMIWLVVFTEAFFFICLIMAFVYMAFNAGFEPYQVSRLDIRATGCYTVLLIASSFTLHLAEKGYALGKSRSMKVWLVATIVLGAIFLGGQGIEYSRLIRDNVTPGTGVFGTSFFTLTGFHAFHVLCGLVILCVLLALSWLGGISRPARVMNAAAVYWHFVDIVWIVVFTVVYVLPKFSSI